MSPKVVAGVVAIRCANPRLLLLARQISVCACPAYRAGAQCNRIAPNPPLTDRERGTEGRSTTSCFGFSL
ncbi:hypothetical protein [Vibrio penaeicida]|uniref:hypothetical protein n=1 Tax=Vibrio penaeicida TaxID=104609 RepID=UPI001CC4494F|nr:hypothetical protein [Vibrio penaeicida]